MTKKIDEIQIIKDFHEGKLYAEIALKHKCGIGTIAYRLKKLGLKKISKTGSSFQQKKKIL